MRLLVFAHTPPPFHGQSYMVQQLLDGMGGDQRRSPKPAEGKPQPPELECFHVNARYSTAIAQIARPSLGKFLKILRYIAEAFYCRFRYRVRTMLYVPAPGMRVPVVRDWLTLALCRPIFPRLVLYWQAAGLGSWLKDEARPYERWLTHLFLDGAALSIVLGPSARADAEVFRPETIAIVPNGIPDPCPDCASRLIPLRGQRARTRAELLAEAAATAPRQPKDPPTRAVFQVLFMSLCTREKGLFDTIDAVALANRQLVAQHSPLRIELRVAGKFWRPEEEEEFRRRLCQPDLQVGASSAAGQPTHPTVRYVGFAQDSTKRELFESSDCLCFPSYYPAESFPVVLVEAMAYGLPVLTSHWRSIPELLPPGYPHVVPPRTPEELARHFLNLAETYPGGGLRQRFETHFNIATVLKSLKSSLLALDKPDPADSVKPGRRDRDSPPEGTSSSP